MPIDSNLLLLLRSNQLGEGEPDLGAKLMDSFLKMLLESGRLPARIICINSGIFLTTVGSAVIETLGKIEASGSQILSCSTCLAYFKRGNMLLIGKPTNMQETVASLLTHGKILAP